ncbi:MAG: alginate export family protein [Gammaproteobacteria bacterium]|nr:alginate export family protein [Gammaproteobacteria bacterium]
MKNVIKMSLASAMFMNVVTVYAQVDTEISIFDNVKVNGEIRPRYEFVDQDNVLSNANALTNRLTLGVNADLFATHWLSAYVEMTDVHNVNNNYNSTDNGEVGHSTVVDPEQTRVTQSYLDFKYNKSKLRAGRQMINLDNQRFVGAVGWRQMPQTFDAWTLTDSSVENLDLFVSYMTQTNTVRAGNTDSKDSETLIFNGRYKLMDELTVTGYGYLVSQGVTGNDSSDTYGVSLTGNTAIDAVKIDYRLEYAKMTDASLEVTNVGKADHDSDYFNLTLGANISGILAGVGYEVLGADKEAGVSAFYTPLATLHAFNGWADIFLASTPVDGLEDISLMAGYKSKDFGLLKAIYHDFSAEQGGTDYGTELDILYTRAIPAVKGLTGVLKYADYNADALNVDTQKFWVMLDYKFSN